jgi:hypothetical protein
LCVLQETVDALEVELRFGLPMLGYTERDGAPDERECFRVVVGQR